MKRIWMCAAVAGALLTGCNNENDQPIPAETITVDVNGGTQMYTIKDDNTTTVHSLRISGVKGDGYVEDDNDGMDNKQILEVEGAWMKATHLPMSQEVSLSFRANPTRKQRELRLTVTYEQKTTPRVIRIVQNP